MPELAEVEAVRLQIDRRLKGKQIKEVILDEEDRFFFAFARPTDVRKALHGARVVGTGRKGKYFC